MPIPLLFIAIGAGAAALGVGKSIKAGVDQKDANDTDELARDIVYDAKESANTAWKNSGDAITNLGKVKIKVLEDSMKPFIASFEKLHNVELTESVGMDELQKFRIDKQSFDELKDMQVMAASIVGVQQMELPLVL